MDAIVADVIAIIEEGRRKAYTAVNTAMVEAYWLTGKRIVEEELQGQDRADYGKAVIATVSRALNTKYGKGFSEAALYGFKKFYATFPEEKILYTVCTKLTWSHNRLIMRVSDPKARDYYLKEAAEQNWGVRALDQVESEMLEGTESLKQDPNEFIRNPAVLEFLNIPTNYAYTEKKLEQALIDNIQHFLLEIGQLDMYVRMFDDLEKRADDNPTVGILLCTETDRTIAKYSVLNESKQLFASKYLPYLPTEEELAAEIEREKQIFREEIASYGLKI